MAMTDIVEKIREALSIMLPPNVVFEVGPCAEITEELHPAEALQATKYGSKRLVEFRASRTLARRLLIQLGQEPAAILNGENREPIWPAGIAGTISHSGDVVIVALAHEQDVMSLGVDIEVRDSLKQDLWSKILCPQEIAFVEKLDDGEAGRLSLLFFSAKESFYKAQFPLTRKFLSFDSISLEKPDEERRLHFTIHDQETVDRLEGNDIELRGISTATFALSTCRVL
ncbi:MAG: 4'-phosphopantetheinyl transferase EntD [Planctomycetota bacterium]|jgi:4'-phosphopantetheinyl transferase EntD